LANPPTADLEGAQTHKHVMIVASLECYCPLLELAQLNDPGFYEDIEDTFEGLIILFQEPHSISAGVTDIGKSKIAFL